MLPLQKATSFYQEKLVAWLFVDLESDQAHLLNVDP